MKKIVIIDDHKLVRTGLKALISDMEGYEVVAEGSTGKELLEIIKTVLPDLIILDITMPEMTGIEALEELHLLGLHYNILMASMHNEYTYIKRCLDLGAMGFIFKDEEDEEYYKAINSVSRGEKYCSPKCIRLIEHAN